MGLFLYLSYFGGMPIVGDEVYDYTSGMDITTLQVPRATESAMYDYIIEECKTIAEMLPNRTFKEWSSRN